MIKLLRYLKKYWLFALLAPLFMVGEVAMDLILTSKMQEMIDFGVSASNLSVVKTLGFQMIAIVLAGVLCGVLSGVFTNLASQKFANDIRKDLFKKIMNLSYEQTDDFSTSSLITRVSNDVTAVQNMVSMALRTFIRSFGMFALGIIFTLNISSRFAIVLAIALPLELLAMALFMKKTFPLFGTIQKKLDRVTTVVHENVSGARVVKAFSKEDHEFDRFKVAHEDWTNTTLYVNKIIAALMPVFMLIVYIGTLSIYYIGGSSIFAAYDDFMTNHGVSYVPDITIGQTTQAITYISMIMMSMIMLGMTFANLARAVASAKRINEVLDSPILIHDGNLDVSTLTKKGEVEFKNVSFAYPGAKGNVLENINLTIHQGETIAIVGSTGSGKSSLVNLITRFYDVTEGTLLIDGVDVKEFRQHDLREKIAIVLQKAELFAGTIKDNIRWGKENATDEEVMEAAQIAQAEEFILSKEKKYDEYVEEKGTSLSGGQKQRLSIARAIIKKPEILIFDDSTSALDLVTEAKLYQAMRKTINDTTRIVVAQRIATAKNADKIAVLDGGTIIAFDTHENLLKNCKVYQDIYDSQLKKEGDLNG